MFCKDSPFIGQIQSGFQRLIITALPARLEPWRLLILDCRMQIEKHFCRTGKQEISGQNLKSAIFTQWNPPRGSGKGIIPQGRSEIRNIFGTDGTDLAAISA
jgi:hypothetical protein